MKKLHIILGSILLFLSILFVGVALNNIILPVIGILLAPIIILVINKKTEVKPSKYYSTLSTILLVTFILAGVFIKPVEKTEITDSGQTVEDNSIVTTDPPKQEDEENKNVLDKETVKETVKEIEAKIHFINTGNSDSILIVKGEKSVLIDAGDNDDEGLVLNYIKNQGITNLTYVISTHPDADHSGGLDSVINSIGVSNLFVSNKSADTKTYTDFIKAAANKGVGSSVPLEGSEHKLSESSYIKFFNTNGGSDSNESSLVTLFVNGNDKMLFMGDAEQETENEIVSQMPDVDLIKIGHHGSKTSTTQSFLDKVSPEYAVILTGSSNKYGHPTSTVLDRLKLKSVDLHRTDECGDIIFISNGERISTSCGKASFTPGDGGSSETTTSSEPTSNNVTNTAPQTNEPVVPETAVPETNGQTVILTVTGEKYHRSSCRTIKKVKSEVSIEDAKSQGYGPCGVCKP